MCLIIDNEINFKFMKYIQAVLWLYYVHRHVSATHVTIFRVIFVLCHVLKINRHDIPTHHSPICLSHGRMHSSLRGRHSTHIYIYIYIYIKWSRYRLGLAQRVGRGRALLFHDRGTRRGWVVSNTLRPHFTPGKTRYPYCRRLGGRAENLVPTGIRSQTVQPVVSRYTDWATRPPHTHIHTHTHTHIYIYIYICVCVCM